MKRHTRTTTDATSTTECKEQALLFQDLLQRKVAVDFKGGHLSSDGGGLFLREVEVRTGLLRDFSRCFVDGRDARYVEHSLESLLGPRVIGLALGYEDLNDHDHLRLDPLVALIAEKSDILGEQRATEQDKGKALAGHSTLKRLELGAESTDIRYRKIKAQPEKIEALLIARALKAIPRKTREIVLDLDATEDPLHGAQEGSYFHGYYRNYCYLPLYCLCGNIALWAQLRDCKGDASEGSVEALKKIVPAIRKRFGRKVRIIVRGDSAFAREAIMGWCEGEKVFYCLGVARNSRLEELLAEEFKTLQAQIAAGKAQAPCRSFCEFTYRTLDSWSKERRVVGKAEILAKGDNPRFIVTKLPKEGFAGEAKRGRFEAAALYERFYCARGDMENRIKEQQQDLFADRTSTHWMASNQLRLWFSAFAHLMVSVLRACVLKGTELERASIGQIRLRLFKIAARITVSVRRIHIELCSAYPLKELFTRAHGQLTQLADTG
ncbi:MAG: IS1380 family transposase [Verrucomicrobiales bacterium]